MTARSNNPDMPAVFHTCPYGKFIEIQNNVRRKKLHRTNQDSNYLGGSFSKRDTVRAPIQFRREIQSQHHKRWFFLKSRPIHFHIELSFPTLKSLSHFLPYSTVSCRSDSTSEASSSCSDRSDAWSHFK